MTQNEATTGDQSSTSATRENLISFDFENTRRDLIAMRLRHGADTPKGHACSNAIEQLEALRTYERPAWATHEAQTLPYMLRRTMKILAS